MRGGCQSCPWVVPWVSAIRAGWQREEATPWERAQIWGGSWGLVLSLLIQHSLSWEAEQFTWATCLSLTWEAWVWRCPYSTRVCTDFTPSRHTTTLLPVCGTCGWIHCMSETVQSILGSIASFYWELHGPQLHATHHAERPLRWT